MGGEMLETVNLHLQEKGVRITTGTIVDATIIHAPSSTKNHDQQRDPEMHQTKKGKDWYFGMKAHVGVDSKNKIIHSAVVTPANVADSAVLPELLHGEETRVWGDGAYQGQKEIIHQSAPRARDCTQRRCRYKDHIDEVERAKNRTKSRVRSRVEHVFGVMKLKFGFLGSEGQPSPDPRLRASSAPAAELKSGKRTRFLWLRCLCGNFHLCSLQVLIELGQTSSRRRQNKRIRERNHVTRGLLGSSVDLF